MTTSSPTHTTSTRGARTVGVGIVSIAVAMFASACLAASVPWTSDVPAGHVDEASLDRSGTLLTVRGWTGDRNTTEPIAVVLFVDGELQTGSVVADQPRPDVLAATGRGERSGFDATVTVERTSQVTVCVSAMNVGPGDNALLGCRTATRGGSSPSTTTTVPSRATTTTTTVPPVDCDAAPAPGVNLSGCDLSDMDLRGVDLSGATLRGTSFRGSNLSDAKFIGTDARGADFDRLIIDADKGFWSGTALNRVSFEGADLTGATMFRADMQRVVLDSANLTGANLSEAFLIDYSGVDTVWSDTTCPDGTVQDTPCPSFEMF